MNSESLTESDVLGLAYTHCPGFEQAVDKELDAEDRMSAYAVAGCFARYLLDAYKSDDMKTLQSAADFIENLLLHGNQKVRELATVGYLEDIQNVWGNNGVDPAAYYEYLLPTSKKQWDELNSFWSSVAK